MLIGRCTVGMYSVRMSLWWSVVIAYLLFVLYLNVLIIFSSEYVSAMVSSGRKESDMGAYCPTGSVPGLTRLCCAYCDSIIVLYDSLYRSICTCATCWFIM